MVQVRYEIPEELRRRFKTICVSRDVQMKEQFATILRDWVEQQERGEEGSQQWSDEEKEDITNKVMRSCWLKVARSEKLTNNEIIKLAGLLGVDPERLKGTLEASGLQP